MEHSVGHGPCIYHHSADTHKGFGAPSVPFSDGVKLAAACLLRRVLTIVVYSGKRPRSSPTSTSGVVHAWVGQIVTFSRSGPGWLLLSSPSLGLTL